MLIYDDPYPKIFKPTFSFHELQLRRRYKTFTTREREAKINSSIFIAEELGQDLHDFGVEPDTELTTRVNIVEYDDSGCELKRKQVPQKSKLFTSRLENARRSKHVFKKGNIESVNAEHCKFEVGSGNSAPTFYQVYICTEPSCSCSDFNTYGMRSLCKHILFVLLFALEVTDIN